MKIIQVLHYFTEDTTGREKYVSFKIDNTLFLVEASINEDNKKAGIKVEVFTWDLDSNETTPVKIIKSFITLNEVSVIVPKYEFSFKIFREDRRIKVADPYSDYTTSDFYLEHLRSII